MSGAEQVVRQFWDAFNDHDYARLAGALSEQCEWLAVPTGKVFRGPDPLVAGLREFLKPFPDGRGEILNLVAAGDTVVVEWRVTGTHTGPLNGREATGKTFERRGCSVAEVRGGKIVGYRDYFDRLTLIEQLGLTPQS
jgi:steroid delta-isomerase-like uncharacterized protein